MAKFAKRQAGSDNIGNFFVAAIVILVLIYTVWFFATHERVDTDLQYRPKPEVTQNPYYAASLLLKQQGKSAHYINQAQVAAQFDQLLLENAQGQILMVRYIAALSSDQLKQLQAWVQAGGHLIVFSQIRYDETMDLDVYYQNENPVLVHFGITNHEHLLDFTDNPLQLKSWTIPVKIGDQVVVLPASHEYFDTKVLFERYPKATWVDDYRALGGQISLDELSQNFNTLTLSQKQQLFDFATQNSHYGDPQQVMVDVYLDQGRLTVLHDSVDFSNPQGGGAIESQQIHAPRLLRMLRDNSDSQVYQGAINHLDSAYFLSYLSKDAQAVWFIEQLGNQSAGLLPLLVRQLPFVLIALLLAVFAALLGLPRQFGRRQVIQDDSGRNLMLYFDGVGQYLWAADLCVAQVTANRERLLEKIQAKLPKIVRLKSEQVCQLVAQDANLPVPIVYEALYGTWQSQDEFVKISRSFALLAKVYL